MTYILAQITGLMCTVFSLCIAHFKKVSHILLGEILLNFTFIINYALLGGWSGVCTAGIATVQAVIISFFNRKDKKFPIWLSVVFVGLYALVTIVTFKTFKDIFPFIGSTLFTIAIRQKKPFYYRLLKLTLVTMWLIYDLCMFSFGSATTRILSISSYVIAIIRNDINKKTA